MIHRQEAQPASSPLPRTSSSNPTPRCQAKQLLLRHRMNAHLQRERPQEKPQSAYAPYSSHGRVPHESNPEIRWFVDHGFNMWVLGSFPSATENVS